MIATDLYISRGELNFTMPYPVDESTPQPHHIYPIVTRLQGTLRRIGITGESADGEIETRYSRHAYGVPEGFYYTFTNSDRDRVGVGAKSFDPSEILHIAIYHGDDFDADRGDEPLLLPHEGHGFNYQSHYQLHPEGHILAAAFRKLRTDRGGASFREEYKQLRLPAAMFEDIASRQLAPTNHPERPFGKGNKEIGAKFGWKILNISDPETILTVKDRNYARSVGTIYPIIWT